MWLLVFLAAVSSTALIAVLFWRQEMDIHHRCIERARDAKLAARRLTEDTYEVPSQSGGAPHLVLVNEFGHAVFCDCKSFEHRGDCTHIATVRLEVAKARQHRKVKQVALV